jgi:hypothetical protein
MLLGVLAASVLLGALAGPAAARNLSISNQALRSQFREVNFRLPFFTSRCQLTLEASYHMRTIAKVQGSLVGYVTTARLGPCSAGSVTILTETLPWHIRYLAFSGSLPNITDLVVNAIGVSFRIREPFGVNCLSTSTAAEPAILTALREAATGALTGARLGGSIRTGEECFREVGTFESDTGTVTVLGSTSTRITVRLI